MGKALGAAAAALILAAGVGGAAAQLRIVEVQSGKATVVRAFFNCSTHRLPASASGSATHGTVTTQYATGPYCFNEKEPVLLLLYEPEAGFIGADGVNIFLPGGQTESFPVTVKAAPAAAAPPTPPAPPPQTALQARPPAPPVALCANAAAGADAARSCLRPKDSFKDCADCPDMVVLPAGKFAMGSPNSDPLRAPEEAPEHAVTIANAFAVGKFPVTRGQFAAFVTASGYAAGTSCTLAAGTPVSGNGYLNPSYAQDDRHPAVCVSWNDAKAYVAWLAKKTGQPYRLLSEAEWEYAQRAGTTTPFWFGSSGSDACKAANGFDETFRARFPAAGPVVACRDGYVFTSPIGTFAANAFGLYDMGGNALGWVEDCFRADYVGAPTDGGVWKSDSCSTRTLRGASWRGSERALRSAHRQGAPPADRLAWAGFRVARAIPR